MGMVNWLGGCGFPKIDDFDVEIGISSTQSYEIYFDYVHWIFFRTIGWYEGLLKHK